MKTQLTKEQSQHLIDLGVSKEKASLQVLFEEDGPFDIWNEDILSRPIFTLTDLLEILPKEIEYKSDGFLYMCPISITWGCSTGKDHDIWFAVYDDYGETGFESQFCAKELIDALYELCMWCLEKKYL